MNSCPCCEHQPVTNQSGESFSCPACGHQWLSAIPTPDIYLGQSGRNEGNISDTEKKFNERASSILKLIQPTSRVLEIGCAEGRLGEIIKSKCNVHYDGVEISDDAKAAEKKLDNIYSSVELVAGIYDFIISFHVLEHLENPLQELSTWKSLLSYDGILILEVPRESGHPLLDNDLNREHLHQFSVASLGCLLHHAGFDIIHVETGKFESRAYPDSIRIMARFRPTAGEKKNQLLSQFRKLSRPFIIWGMGGDFKKFILPVITETGASDLVDSS